MCGIAGVFGRSNPSTVAAMLQRLRHRGPDDGHQASGAGHTLGARRLSIVDVEGGRQPLANEDGTIWAAQNGELYNFPSLRPRLLQRGHQLRSHCDTEVLPHLWEDHGAELVSELDGMFAVAVWDERRQCGLLARDRCGKKPLYYLTQGDALYFASEIKALLEVPGFIRRLNLEALHHYLSYKHVPCPLSIFEGIHALPPAHRLVFSREQGARIERYWSLDFSGSEVIEAMTDLEATDRLLDLLRAAVRKRLMADVPIGFFLSGGLDSSLTTALAAELSTSPIKTFSLTYAAGSSTAGKEQDRHWARWVAERYQTEHLEAVVDFASFPDQLRAILTAFDEPFCGVVSTYFLSQLMARHVKVALSGDGADELFGSYLSHRLAQPLAHYDEYQRTGNADLIRPFEQSPDTLERFAGRPDWDWRTRLFVLDEAAKQSLYHPDVAAQMSAFDSGAHLRQAFDGLTARDPLNRILEAEFHTLLPDQVLTFVDRLSMAHSLEVRTAYLDTEVVQFVASLPARMKIRDGICKVLLKQAGLRYFPQEMVQRPKEGFFLPITDWLRFELEDYVRDTLSAARLQRHGLFEAARVETMLDDFYHAPAVDYTQANPLLALLVFQEWYELYLA